jgi:hypothetical protein
MATLAQANLTTDERDALGRFLELLKEDLGDDLLAVWLYGSRARGEGKPPDSDVDVLVLTRDGRADFDRVHGLLWRNYWTWPDATVLISAHTQSAEWVQGRREIEAFFIQEVDRDKIVLYGEP